MNLPKDQDNSSTFSGTATQSGLIAEISSIAQGYVALDQSLKAASVHVIEAAALNPGKFLIVMKASTIEIEKARQSIATTSKDFILDLVTIPNLDQKIIDALYGLSRVEAKKNGVLVLETSGLASMLSVLHPLVTSHSISVIEVRSGRDIGGKSTAFLTGSTESLKAALDNFVRITKPTGRYINAQNILNPTNEFLSYFNISGEV